MLKGEWSISIMTGFYWVIIAVLSTIILMNLDYVNDMRSFKSQTESELVRLRSRNATLEKLIEGVEDEWEREGVNNQRSGNKKLEGNS